jgi:hypothetical protein
MYHGPWLQLPLEQLEYLVEVSTSTPRPQPYDSGVLWNILRIRKAVEEATDLAVRAHGGYISAPSLPGGAIGKGVMSNAEALGLSLGNKGPSVKLSKERQFRMREMAAQKLAEAYRLDEIATSVATMQSASPLDELAQHVLNRNPNDLDALYVHFFHEKIPTRKLAEYTSLEPLDRLTRESRHAASAFRTRAVAKMFKEDWDGAIQDLTDGLRESRIHTPLQHNENTLGTTPESKAEFQRAIEAQLYFYRANVQLKLASRSIQEALDYWEIAQTGKFCYAEESGTPKPDVTQEGAKLKHLEMRKVIKGNAKRALRDYMSFFSLFEYSPSVPNSTARNGDGGKDPEVYKVSELFMPNFPVDRLPKFPPGSAEGLKQTRNMLEFRKEFVEDLARDPRGGRTDETFEFVNFHPLLPESLCSMLLCHAIIQTPATELRRHSYMAARLIRLLAGVPVFSVGRAGSGADWGEILQNSGTWLNLSHSWTELCGPRKMTSIEDDDPGPRHALSAVGKPLTAEERRSRVFRMAMKDSLGEKDGSQKPLGTLLDNGKTCEPVAVSKTAVIPHTAGVVPINEASPVPNGHMSAVTKAIVKSATVIVNSPDRCQTFSTARAEAITRWIQEAPATVEAAGGTRHKKSAKKRIKRAGPVDKGYSANGVQVVNGGSSVSG